jgi:hypothetical protein
MHLDGRIFVFVGADGRLDRCFDNSAFPAKA